MKISPFTALLYTLSAWLLVMLSRATSLGGEYASVAGFTWMVITVWLASFAFGGILFATSIKPSHRNQIDSVASDLQASRWITGLSCLAAVGAAMVTYEFAVIRGYGFSVPIAVIRSTEVVKALTEGVGSSPFSGIGRLLTHALHGAWILWALSTRHSSRSSLLVLFGATALVIWQQATFEGGRFFLACLVFSVLLTWRLKNSPAGTQVRSRLSSTSKFLVTLIVCGVVGMFGYTFVSRYDSIDVIELTGAYQAYTAGMPINLPPHTLDRLQGEFEQFWFALYMMWTYVTGGINELDLLLQFPDTKLGFGAAQFSQMGQILTRLIGSDLTYDVFANMPRPGVYTTFLGPSYMDFGVYITWILAPFLGYFSSACVFRLKSGNITALSLSAPLILLICIFSPVVSLTVSLWPSIAWTCLAGSRIRSLSTMHSKGGGNPAIGPNVALF